jgi:hypothetical protein
VRKAELHILSSTLFDKLEENFEVFRYGHLPSRFGMVHGESDNLSRSVKVRASSSLIHRDLELSSKTSVTVSNTILTLMTNRMETHKF